MFKLNIATNTSGFGDSPGEESAEIARILHEIAGRLIMNPSIPTIPTYGTRGRGGDEGPTFILRDSDHTFIGYGDWYPAHRPVVDEA